MEPIKIGYIVPPGIFTGGQSNSEQDSYIIEKIEKIYSSIKNASEYVTLVDTTYPLGAAIAQISISYSVPVIRVQPFNASVYTKKHPSTQATQNINDSCSGIVVIGTGAYSPSKIKKSQEYIMRHSDKLIVIGPDVYKKQYGHAATFYIETPLQISITNATT